MTYWQEQQCEEIVSRAKFKASVNGSNLNLANILTEMVIEIGEVFGYDVRDNIPSDLKMTIYAYTAGSGINKLLTGWIPFVGKAVNHASAYAMPDDVSQEAIQYFRALRQKEDNEERELLEAFDSLRNSLMELSSLFDDDYY